MKKNIILLSVMVFILTCPLAHATEIWAVAATNVHFNMGCDTIWFKMWSPIPTLENARGKVVEITTHMEDKDADIINPKNLVPYTDSEVWLSDDRYTIFVVIRNVKRFEPNLRQGIGEFNGPFYGIQINNRFSPKKDNTPDEVLFKEHNMGYSLSSIERCAAIEEGTRMILKEKIGSYWYAPYYVDYQFKRGDTIVPKMQDWITVEDTHYENCDYYFGDRKFLNWEIEGDKLYGVEFTKTSNVENYLGYKIHCEAITGGTDVKFRPVYSKPIQRWNLTITMDSTIRKFNGAHYFPSQQWNDDIWGEDHITVPNDSVFQLSMLKDSANYFDIKLVTAITEKVGLPMRLISNVPEFNSIGDGSPYIIHQLLYYHPGFDSVHIHFTRAEVNSVEENVPEAGLQQLQWQTTSERDILLKTPFLWEPGQIELYTIVGSMIERLDLSNLSRSGEGTLLPTATIPSGTYIVLVKSKNYRSGTVLQIIH